MKFLSCDDILKATGGTLLSGDKSIVFRNIATDSRKIAEGDLFIPLVGSNFDGHAYIQECLEKGAYGSITQKMIIPCNGKVIIRVGNTLKALGSIAALYRSKFDIPVIAVTGSVGKTSTKDLIASALGSTYKVLKTEANYNNEIGLPMTLLKLDDEYKAAVVEMGMRGFGEISYLTEIARPDIAVITNIGMSHIERLGSRENICRAKMEITDGLARDGLMILNGDDDQLYALKDKLEHRKLYYGLSKNLDLVATDIKNLGIQGTSFTINMGRESYEAEVSVPGIHNVYNALAAFAAGMELSIDTDVLIKGIKEYSPGQMRLDIKNVNGICIINDTYNASPQSMEAAIGVLRDIAIEGRSFAVLGDMLEMGEWAYEAHKNIGKYAFINKIKNIITVGENAVYIAEGAIAAGAASNDVRSFDNNAEAVKHLKSVLKAGDTVLVKGSRGMKMEEIVESFTKDIM